MAPQTVPIPVSFFLVTALSLSSASSYAQLSYSDHCASIVPESSPSKPYPYLSPRIVHDGYFRAPNPSSYSVNKFNFGIRNFHETHVEGLFMVDGYWGVSVTSSESVVREGHGVSYYRSSYFYRRQSAASGGLIPWGNFSASAEFRLNGFWLESTGKLCMVGLGSLESTGGKQLGMITVLKLNNFKSSTNFTSLISGTLDLLGSENYTLPLFMLPEFNYSFTLGSEQIGNETSYRNDFPQGLPLSSLPNQRRCPLLYSAFSPYILKYSSRAPSIKSYSPFGESLDFLPKLFCLDQIRCYEDGKRMRFLMVFAKSNREFRNMYSAFNPNMSLIGEASWDEKINQTNIVACRFLGIAQSFDDARLGDCSIRMSFLYPKTRSIRDNCIVSGRIWSTKGVDESGYFDMIIFQQSEIRGWQISVDVKYEYTEIENLKKFFPTNKPIENNTMGFTDEDLKFDVLARSSREIFSGYFTPRFVGDHQFGLFSTFRQDIMQSSSGNKVNISYTIYIGPVNKNVNPIDEILKPSVNILAEGVYDFETGKVCMIGCRYHGPTIEVFENSSIDCQIIVKIDFPLSGTNQSYVKGSIESLRKTHDPLYFEQWEFVSSAFGWAAAEESIWRLDMGVVMVLISTTFACMFLVLQLFHVKKHPQVLPFISIPMLLLLALGCMIPLVLTFEASSMRKPDTKNLAGNNGWLVGDEVLIRVLKMVAFLLQVYLLQLAWSARWTDKNKIEIWAAEKKALAVTLFLYTLVGSVVALFIISPEDYHNLLEIFRRNLKFFCSLALDAFLLPQILINLFGNFRGKLLCSWFYAGNMVVQLLDHALNVFRANGLESARSFSAGNATDLFHSSAWDVTILLGGLVLVIVIYLQQKLGGRFCLPGNFVALEMKHKKNNQLMLE